MKSKPWFVNQKEFAELWDVSAATVMTWIDAGMPSTGGGTSGASKRIDLKKALPWLKDYFSRAAQYESQKERKASVESDILEIKRDKMLMNLLDFAFVSEALTETITELLNDLLANPGRRCQEFAAEDSPAVIRATMREDAVRIADGFSSGLAQLAQFSEDTAESIGASEAATDTDSDAVG
jgi:phage terminase Nu1 subunit (DNA packaging protein)